MKNIKRALIILFGLDDFLREKFNEGKRLGKSYMIRRLIVDIGNKKYKTLEQLRSRLLALLESEDI